MVNTVLMRYKKGTWIVWVSQMYVAYVSIGIERIRGMESVGVVSMMKPLFLRQQQELVPVSTVSLAPFLTTAKHFKCAW